MTCVRYCIPSYAISSCFLFPLYHYKCLIWTLHNSLKKIVKYIHFNNKINIIYKKILLFVIVNGIVEKRKN